MFLPDDKEVTKLERRITLCYSVSVAESGSEVFPVWVAHASRVLVSVSHRNELPFVFAA